MSADIEVELKRISRLVDEELKRASEESNRRGMLYSGMTINLKYKYSTQKLEKELKLLTADYYSESDINKILEFIDYQRDKIHKSIKKDRFSFLGFVPLDSRIEEIKGIVTNKQYLTLNKNKSEWIKFWIPVCVSAAALIVSIIALIKT